MPPELLAEGKRLRNSAVTACYRSACNKAVDYKAKVVFLDHLFFPHNEQNLHAHYRPKTSGIELSYLLLIL